VDRDAVRKDAPGRLCCARDVVACCIVRRNVNWRRGKPSTGTSARSYKRRVRAILAFSPSVPLLMLVNTGNSKKGGIDNWRTTHFMETLFTHDIRRHVPGYMELMKTKYPSIKRKDYFEKIAVSANYTSYPPVMDVVSFEDIRGRGGGIIDPLQPQYTKGSR